MGIFVCRKHIKLDIAVPKILNLIDVEKYIIKSDTMSCKKILQRGFSKKIVIM